MSLRAIPYSDRANHLEDLAVVKPTLSRNTANALQVITTVHTSDKFAQWSLLNGGAGKVRFASNINCLSQLSHERQTSQELEAKQRNLEQDFREYQQAN